MKVKSEREVAQMCPTLATPWTAAYQAPPSMGFSRQKYWSGVPLSSPDSIIITAKMSNVPGRGERMRGKGDIVSVQSRKGGKVLLVCLQN